MRLLWIFCFLLGWQSSFATENIAWYAIKGDGQVRLQVDLFMTSTCPHCHKAQAWLVDLEKKLPWIELHQYVIDKNTNDLHYFAELIKQQGTQDFRIPAIFFCDSRWTGFDQAETSGKEILRGLTYCYEQIKKEGQLSSSTSQILQRWAYPLQYAGSQSEQNASPWLLTFVVALFDAMNPCALFALACFMAYLAVFRDQVHRLWLGMAMVGLIGLFNFWQGFYVQTFYQILPWLRIPAIGVGGLMVWQASRFMQAKSCPHLIIALPALFMVLSYQQTCLLDWTLYFQQWSSLQAWSIGLKFIFFATYFLVYLSLLILLWLLVEKFFKLDLSKKTNYALNYITAGCLIILGLFLVVYPSGLNQFAWSVMVLIPLIVLGWLQGRYRG